MAGLDYSHVREPDYDFEQIRQSADITRIIENEVQNILSLWKRRGKLRAQIRRILLYPARKKYLL